MLAIWVVGMAVLLFRYVLGVVVVWRISRQARRVDDEGWLTVLGETAHTLVVRRRVVLLKSRQCKIPMTWGVMRPVVLLPARTKSWSVERRQVVLAHELAHVKRHDCLTQLVAQVVRALYWFNPLVWLAWRRLLAESEQACDDLVLAQGSKASDYAEHLLTVASGSKADSLLPTAAIAMARPSQLQARLLAILDEKRNRRTLTRIAMAMALLLVTAVVVPLSVLKAVEENQAGTNADSSRQADPQRAKPDETVVPRHIVAASQAAEANPDQAKVIAEIEKLGGKVTVDEKSPDKPVIQVIFNHTQVTDAGLEYVKGLPKLQLLELWDTQVTDAGLEHIQGLTQLQSLVLGVTKELGATKVTDAGLKHLKGLTNLQTLNLSGTQVTDAGLEHLKGLTRLQTLWLTHTKVGDAGLENLKGLRSLQMLVLNNTQVTDAGLEHLKGLSNLHILILESTKVTDAGLAHLRGLSNLQHLDLSHTKVTDAGLKQLKALTNLRSLYLIGTQVTDAGLEHLHKLTTLRQLCLGATRVTDEGVKRFRQVLPNCKIDRSVPAETPQSSTSASPKAAAVRDTEAPPPRLDRRRQQERFQSRQRQLPRSRNSAAASPRMKRVQTSQ